MPIARFVSRSLPIAAAALLVALGGPGVEVRADAGARGATPSGATVEIGADAESCRVPDPAAERRTTDQAMALLQARLAAEADAAGGEFVVLNGRGYNYDRDRRVDPVRELQILRRDEAAQAARDAAPKR